MLNDDISNVLILNKKSIANQESQLFQTELEKFRPHQNRLLQANHKQTALMKELTKTYGDLLQDKRVRAEQSKYEAITRQRNTVMLKYRKVYNAFKDVNSGLGQAQTFYTEMKETIDSLKKNVDTFVNNRRAEGGQLLSQIERDKAHHTADHDDRGDQEKLKQVMERLSMVEPTPTGSSSAPKKSRPAPVKVPSSQQVMVSATKSPPPTSPDYQPTAAAAAAGHPASASYLSYVPGVVAPPGGPYIPGQSYQLGPSTIAEGYNPMAYLYQLPISPPPNQQFFASGPAPYAGYPNSQAPMQQPPGPPHTPQFMQPGYIPPPPPPRPSQPTYPPSGGPYPSGPGGYAQVRPYSTGQQRQSQPQPGAGQGDPWAGLNAWR